jgi:hypothetical protein
MKPQNQSPRVTKALARRKIAITDNDVLSEIAWLHQLCRRSFLRNQFSSVKNASGQFAQREPPEGLSGFLLVFVGNTAPSQRVIITLSNVASI